MGPTSGYKEEAQKLYICTRRIGTRFTYKTSERDSFSEDMIELILLWVTRRKLRIKLYVHSGFGMRLIYKTSETELSNI